MLVPWCKRLTHIHLLVVHVCISPKRLQRPKMLVEFYSLMIEATEGGLKLLLSMSISIPRHVSLLVVGVTLFSFNGKPNSCKRSHNTRVAL